MSESDHLLELYTEVTTPDQLRAIEWVAEEELCGSFVLKVTATVPVAMGDAIASQLFGQKATFVAHGATPLVRRGVVSSVSIGGSRDVRSTELAITVVPRLDLMRLRTSSRIFQNASTSDVLVALAKEWRLPYDLRLSQTYGKRRYITQYRESDLDFLRRIASRDGIGYFLDHAELDHGERSAPGDEKLVFYDSEQAYPHIPQGADPTRGHRLAHDREGFERQEHHVGGFRLERKIAPEHVRLGDFDFRKPRLQMRASAATAPEKRSPINTSLGGEHLSVYMHSDRAELDVDGGRAEISDALAAVRLQQAQRDAAIGRGTSRCMRLSPGLVFALEDQPEAPSLNQGYVVTRIVHRGHVPEDAAAGSTRSTYENTFECAPSNVVFRPPLPKLDVRQVTETATVVGPKGSEVHTDEFGRVKVQFHWDLGGEGGDSACWLRVVAPWAGTNWGAQFIPRIGMEVLVGFLSGDVDQPIVLGAVYNGTHPMPFTLPEEAGKAGFRTSSMPGGTAGSELSFDDSNGKERALFRAGRDLAQIIKNDFALEVGKSENVRVDGTSERTVGENATTRILGSRVDTIAKNHEQTVGGSYGLAVSANLDLRVTGNRTEIVEGREKYEHKGDLQHEVSLDSVERVLGHKVTIVGEHDARRSATVHVEGSSHHSSTGAHEIVSEKEILFRCGKSMLRLTPDGLDIIVDKVRFVGKDVSAVMDEKIELFTKKGFAVVSETADILSKKRVTVAGESGTLKLAKDARLDGSVVKLNCDPSPPDPLDPPEYKPPEPTHIELLDDTGAPLKNRRFVLTMPDGSEQTGVLDADGKTDVYIEDACDITFPDVDGARRG